ncbi:hypothetical protein [Halosimplex marinum]|uniref:hypothetical protein n=1 Tax=Halosimplex marinum TaxID=3396620 RepID=UPI003F57C6E5
MSETNGENSEKAFDDPFALVVEYEDELIKCEEVVDSALEENLKKASYPLTREDVVHGVEFALRSQLSSDSPSHELAHAILYVVSEGELSVYDHLSENGASNRLKTVISRLSSKYSSEAQMPAIREFQGNDYWHKLETDLVVRDGENIGLNHHLGLRHDEIIEISTSLNSNLRLVGGLLERQTDAIDRFGEEAIEEINPRWVDMLIEDLEEIKAEITEEGEVEE